MFSIADWCSELWDFKAFARLMLLAKLLPQVNDSARVWGSCSFEKTSFTHFFPLQTHNKIHLYCLAFTYRALWVSLSLVCTTERVNLRLQRTGLCNRFTSLSHGTEHRGGSSAGIWASRAGPGTREAFNLCAITTHQLSTSVLLPESTHTEDYLERFSQPA